MSREVQFIIRFTNALGSTSYRVRRDTTWMRIHTPGARSSRDEWSSDMQEPPGQHRTWMRLTFDLASGGADTFISWGWLPVARSQRGRWVSPPHTGYQTTWLLLLTPLDNNQHIQKSKRRPGGWWLWWWRSSQYFSVPCLALSSDFNDF